MGPQHVRSEYVQVPRSELCGSPCALLLLKLRTSQVSGILGLLTMLTFYPIEVQVRITDNK